MKVRVPFLMQVREHIRVTDTQFPEGWENLLRSFGIPLVGTQPIHRTIDWACVLEHYEISYAYTECEEVTNGLLRSGLANHHEVFMDFGYRSPVIAIPAKFFIDHASRFIESTVYEGTVVVTDDGSLFMEFTDDADFRLISNFPIISNS